MCPGLHKLWYPSIRDTRTWSKFGAHGELGDVFLFSNLGGLWFSENSDPVNGDPCSGSRRPCSGSWRPCSGSRRTVIWFSETVLLDPLWIYLYSQKSSWKTSLICIESRMLRLFSKHRPNHRRATTGGPWKLWGVTLQTSYVEGRWHPNWAHLSSLHIFSVCGYRN